MDLNTLRLVYAAVLLACAASLLITWRQNPDELGPRSWALGSVLGGVALVIFAATAANAALLWVEACGDVVAWLGITFYARGTRQYVRLTATPRWTVALLVSAAVAMFGGLAVYPDKPGVTLLTSSFVFAVLCFDLVGAVLRRPETRRAPSWFIAFFFGLFGITHAIRGAITALDPWRPFFDRPVDQALFFVGILGAAATAMGFSMLVTERVLSQKAHHLQILEVAVDDLRQDFEGLAAGDYDVRARERGASEPLDVLARLFNETAAQIGVAFSHVDEQRSVLAATLESMIDGLLLLDADGRIVTLNSAMIGLLSEPAGPAEEASLWLGLPFRDLVDASEHAFADGLIDALEAGPIRERAVRFRAGADALPLTVNASVYRGGDGQVYGAVLVVRDDRSLKDAQAQLQMTGRLAAMGTVAAGVAHEINNPLAFVISNLDFALEELREQKGAPDAELIGELVEALESARRGGERVRQIVVELRTLSRSEGDSTGRVDVNGLITTAIAMLDNEIRHHAQLRLELGEVPPVAGTEAKLGQVFLNLIQNASQAIAPGHAHENLIRVASGTTPDGQVFVEVEDTGAGIRPEDLPRIFDAFFTTKPVGVGTGLGLAISHRAVTGLGGRIEVSSTPGQGARFRVLLPAAPARADREDA